MLRPVLLDCASERAILKWKTSLELESVEKSEECERGGAKNLRIRDGVEQSEAGEKTETKTKTEELGVIQMQSLVGAEFLSTEFVIG